MDTNYFVNMDSLMQKETEGSYLQKIGKLAKEDRRYLWLFIYNIRYDYESW